MVIINPISTSLLPIKYLFFSSSEPRVWGTTFWPVQRNISQLKSFLLKREKLLELDRNTWNDITVYNKWLLLMSFDAFVEFQLKDERKWLMIHLKKKNEQNWKTLFLIFLTQYDSYTIKKKKKTLFFSIRIEICISLNIFTIKIAHRSFVLNFTPLLLFITTLELIDFFKKFFIIIIIIITTTTIVVACAATTSTTTTTTTTIPVVAVVVPVNPPPHTPHQ